MQKAAVAPVPESQPSSMERGGRSHRAPEFSEQPGHLAQLADSINSSPPVQVQMALAEQINEGSQLAQLKRKEEKRPAQRKPLKEKKPPAQTKGNLKDKKTLQGRFAESPAAPSN